MGFLNKMCIRDSGNPIWSKADGSLVQFDTFGSYDYAEYDPSNPSDVSKASSLDASDRKVLGSSMPTWYGGWNLSLIHILWHSSHPFFFEFRNRQPRLHPSSESRTPS